MVSSRAVVVDYIVQVVFEVVYQQRSSVKSTHLWKRMILCLIFAFNVVDCKTLKKPAHGSVYVQGSGPGSIATYSCSHSYTLRGERSRVCLDNRDWDGESPTCEGTKIKSRANTANLEGTHENDESSSLSRSLLSVSASQ